MLNVGGTKNLLFESLFHGAAKNLGSMALQDVVQPIDIVEPLPGSAVNDLGEVEESRFSEFQQLLALQITLAALARYRRHHGCAMRDFAEVMLAKFSGQTFETNQRLNLFRSEEHTSELQSLAYLVCRLLLEKKNNQ